MIFFIFAVPPASKIIKNSNFVKGFLQKIVKTISKKLVKISKKPSPSFDKTMISIIFISFPLFSFENQYFSLVFLCFPLKIIDFLCFSLVFLWKTMVSFGFRLVFIVKLMVFIDFLNFPVPPASKISKNSNFVKGFLQKTIKNN